MKTPLAQSLMAVATGLALTLACVPAGAHGGHHHFHHRVGVFVGIGDPFWPWGYGPAYYPPTIVVPAEPPTYIEKNDSPGSSQSTLYYCDQFQAYYPTVTDCPAGWRTVMAGSAPAQ
jgi:hypothetical protein